MKTWGPAGPKIFFLKVEHWKRVLYENLMSDDFHKKAVLKAKKRFVNLNFPAKDCTNNKWGAHLWLNFSGRLL